MNDLHQKVESIVTSEIKDPTIINPDSNFVVVTYWWGNNNMNANIARPCQMYYELFITQIVKFCVKYLEMIFKQDIVKIENTKQILDNFAEHIIRINEFTDEMVKQSKIYMNTIYVDLDLLNNKDAGRFNCMKKILQEMKRSLTSPKNFSLIEECQTEEECKIKVQDFLTKTAYYIINTYAEDIYNLYYIKTSVNRLKLAKQNKEIDTDTLLEITKENKINYEKINEELKKKLKIKMDISIDDVDYTNVNVYDILNNKLRFRDSRLFQDMISNWENECAKNNCNYLSIEYPEFAEKGGYQLAINAKPIFIKHALRLCDNRAIVYIDGDMFIRKYPRIFDMQNIDYMARGWNMDPRASYNIGQSVYFDPYELETSGGIMYFSQTNEAQKLLDMWIYESALKRNEGKADDRIISLIFNTKKFLLNMNIIQLPIEYLWLTLDYDERMLEHMYDWDKEWMESTIYVEHPECLTTEESAAGEGAASNRQPKFYEFIDLKEDSMPISEEYHEYLNFPDKSMVKEFRAYLEYMQNLQYLSEEDNYKLLELNFISLENPEENEFPLYITKYDDMYGERNEVYENNDYYFKLFNKYLKENTNINELNKNVNGVTIICNKDIYDILDKINLNIDIEEILIPLIVSLIENGYKIIYKPPNCNPDCYLDLISQKQNLELVFIPKLDNMKHILKPSIDLNQPVYFNKENEFSLLSKGMMMFTSLEELSDILAYGLYELISRIRIGYVYKNTNKKDVDPKIVNICPVDIERIVESSQLFREVDEDESRKIENFMPILPEVDYNSNRLKRNLTTGVLSQETNKQNLTIGGGLKITSEMINDYISGQCYMYDNKKCDVITGGKKSNKTKKKHRKKGGYRKKIKTKKSKKKY